jgi:hypothetical protein
MRNKATIEQYVCLTVSWKVSFENILAKLINSITNVPSFILYVDRAYICDRQ